ncbi:MAG: glycosyltransferase family 39 protein [Roseiflexaceae bacterium]|nr:glycosyltransferase family 39 protein [Roseiflexaceae bacterium]
MLDWTTLLHHKLINAEHKMGWTIHWWKIYLGLVLLVSGVLRLGFLSMMEFRHDSAYWALEGYRILQGNYYPLIGQQVGSVQSPLYNGPALSYITAAIFAVFGYQPIAVAAFIALLNVLGVYIVYLLGNCLYSRNVGLILATLASVSPWMVLYGRMFWPQSLFPFLIPLAFLFLIRALETDKIVYYVLFGVLLGLGVQLHLSVLALVGTGFLVLLIYSKTRLKSLVYAPSIALGYIPNIIYDLTSNFVHIRGIVSLPSIHSTDEPRVVHFAKTIWNFTNVLSGQGMWVSKLSKSQYLPSVIDWTQGILYSLIFTACLILIFYNAIRYTEGSWRNVRISYKDAVVLLFLLLPLAYLFFSESPIQRHYFLFLYPMPLLVIARGLELWRLQFSPKYGISKANLFVFAIIPILCSLNLVTLGYGYHFLEKTGGQGEYGTVLSDKQRVVNYIIEHSGGQYKVDLDGVQELLPYVFLFQARGEIVIDGDIMIAHSIQSYPSSHDLPKYRIVETNYHSMVPKTGERIIFQSRGVVVLSSNN